MKSEDQKRIMALCALILPFIVTAGSAHAASGSVVGTVRGPGGVALPGATVTATAGAAPSKTSVVTGDGGEFKIAGLAPGSYTIDAQLTGFHTTSANGVQVDDGKIYSGGVYYAKDAFEAVRILDRVKEGEKGIARSEKITVNQANTKGEKQKIAVIPDQLEFGELLTPPFWGTGEILSWDIQTLLDSIDKRMLFKGYWRAGRLAKEAYKKASETEFQEAFDSLSKEIVSNNLIDPRGYYGFFPVISDDNTLVILSPSDFSTELASFTFPRIEKRKWRCFADYFRPESDIISIQIVTIGAKLGDRCREYFQKEEEYAQQFRRVQTPGAPAFLGRRFGGRSLPRCWFFPCHGQNYSIF